MALLPLFGVYGYSRAVIFCVCWFGDGLIPVCRFDDD
jgi:hypothetical protein